MNGKNLIIHETNGLKYGYRKEGNPGLKLMAVGITEFVQKTG